MTWRGSGRLQEGEGYAVSVSVAFEVGTGSDAGN